MIRKIGTVQHINLITGWEHPKQHEIFCKKEHKLKSVNPYDCEKCPYFVMAGRMDAIVCQWEDTLAAGGYETKIIQRYDSYEEFLRVSELVMLGVLKEG